MSKKIRLASALCGFSFVLPGVRFFSDFRIENNRNQTINFLEI